MELDSKPPNQGHPEINAKHEIDQGQVKQSRFIPKTERASENSLNDKVIEQSRPIISDTMSSNLEAEAQQEAFIAGESMFNKLFTRIGGIFTSTNAT